MHISEKQINMAFKTTDDVSNYVKLRDALLRRPRDITPHVSFLRAPEQLSFSHFLDLDKRFPKMFYPVANLQVGSFVKPKRESTGDNQSV